MPSREVVKGMYENIKKEHPNKTEEEYLRYILLVRPPYDYQDDEIIDEILKRNKSIQSLMDFILDDERVAVLWKERSKNIKTRKRELEQRNLFLYKKFYEKYNSKDIAVLLLKNASGGMEKFSDLLTVDESLFFEGEFVFYSFFLFAGTCMLNDSCDTEFILDIEHSIAEEMSKTLNINSVTINNIIRNRFESYKNPNASTNEDRAAAREDIFLSFLMEDKRNRGFVEIEDICKKLPIVNPICRILFLSKSEYMLELHDNLFKNLKTYNHVS